jgi:hypothetical protein
MGTITRSFANNITTSGVLLPASLTNNSIANVTAYNAAIATGNMVLISSQTASNSATVSFTTGIDSTYKEYQFYFINMHPATTGAFLFNGSTDSGSNYNVTKTTTVFRAYHGEDGSEGVLAYDSAQDLAQSTSFQQIINAGTGTDNDMASCAVLHLFNPSSTTYVKHFIASSSGISGNSVMITSHTAGYFNTTSAINAIQFKFDAGNIDDGTILMYGIK